MENKIEVEAMHIGFDVDSNEQAWMDIPQSESREVKAACIEATGRYAASIIIGSSIKKLSRVILFGVLAYSAIETAKLIFTKEDKKKKEEEEK